MKLAGKVALITGAAKGIGRAIAFGFAQEGVKVVIADIDYRAALNTSNEINDSGKAAFPIEMDVRNKKQVEEAVNQVIEKKGKIDILVNNAGVTGVTRIYNTSDEEWKRIMETNLAGVFYCCRAVIQDMIKRRSGKIINIASIAGKVGGGLLGSSIYAASKAGVIGLSKGMARELATYNINVNTIAPGSIDTDITKKYMTAQQREQSIKRIPLGRRGKPEDIVGAAILLASEESSFITGATIDINGGVLMD